MHLHTRAAGVVLAAQAAGVHSRGRFLDSADVVRDVAAADGEIGILEFDHAPGGIARALEAPPRIFDQSADRFPGLGLRTNADDLDARDDMPLVARVVTFA